MKKPVAISVFLLALGLCAPVFADGALKQGDAQIKRHPSGVAAVYLGERVMWKAPGLHHDITTQLRWSNGNTALAFGVRDAMGAESLVVVLVRDGNHVMHWPIPRAKIGENRPHVTWLGKRRVSFGYTAVRPHVIATWNVRN